ncbi:MAG: hypothetical protein VW010_04535, partial [Flavobacteriaceae bacterium]
MGGGPSGTMASYTVFPFLSLYSSADMDVFSPNILYHGGGELEDGKPKPAPVFGIDMIQSNCIATAGVNESTPPVGCVRLWKIPSVKATDDSSRENDTPKHLIDLCDHLSA